MESVKYFTIIWDEGPPEIRTASSLKEIYMSLEQNPEKEYLLVLEGKHKIPQNAIAKIRKDPVGFEIKFNAFKNMPKTNETPEPVSTPIETNERPFVPPPAVTIQEPQYFEEDGIKFKLENGNLYKQVWEDSEDVKIISIKTGKEYIGNQYKCQTKNWKLICQPPTPRNL